MCVPWGGGGREENGLICRCYTRLTLPPFHLFNERNIRSSNGERFEIGNDLLLTHTHTEVVNWGGGGLDGGWCWREAGVCFPSSTTTQSFMDHGNFQGL